MVIYMKKILLIGELGDIVRSLNDCLAGDFHVQLCTEQLDNIQGMMRIIKPDMVIVCQIGIDELDQAIFEWFSLNYPEIPVLIVTTREEWGRCSLYCETEQFDKIFRPVTKIELILKCSRMMHLGKKNSAKEEEKEEKEVKRKKLLLVDDSKVALRMIKAMLDERGIYDTIVADSGEKALKLLSERHPDLVLLDYFMPGMDGKDTFEAMLDDEYGKDIPVIFLSAIADRKSIYSVLRSKPAGYILKPPDRDKMFEEIEMVLGVNNIHK